MKPPRSITAALLIVTLASCGAPGASPSIARTASLAGGGTCPDADPTRDGPLVDAIRRDDATPVQAALARNPGDPRAAAAFAIISGNGRPDPDQAACFAPYLATG